ncbi:hypothetical protein [Pectobacterium versatile]|uniref:hypothetical protein n=1 Tax=Pectobacterium versatile TaxID=2488639 RepID=UPI0037FD1ECD
MLVISTILLPPIKNDSSKDAYYRYYDGINELRRMNHLENIQADENDFVWDGEFCQIAVKKPANYQYGTWCVEVLLSEEAITIPSVCLRFPRLPHRLFLAASDGPYTCEAISEEAGSERGVQCVNGE